MGTSVSGTFRRRQNACKVTIKPERFLEPWFERIEVGWKMFDFVGPTFILSCGIKELALCKSLKM
jgi:hypothetical protein